MAAASMARRRSAIPMAKPTSPRQRRFPGLEEPTDADIKLAQQLLAEWGEGRGTSKSQLEIRTWNDATAHGRRFDRFIRRTLGVPTTRPSRQTDRIAELEQQIWGLGHTPRGATSKDWELQLLHTRRSCLEALRIWNDPTATFRTGAFSLLFMAAWNGLAIAILQREGLEWRKRNKHNEVVTVNETEQARDTSDLMKDAFPGDERKGLRQNVQFWMEVRNAVAHRHLPALDLPVIPFAQAGVLNLEDRLVEDFGPEHSLADSLTVPLQLSGFRDPGVLRSRRKLQASLPLDVQAILSRADQVDPELLSDQSYLLRVAFVPAVPASGRSPDAIAYFVKPGDVPTELGEALERYVLLPKVAMGARPNLSANEVIQEVSRRTGFKFHSGLHAEASRRLGIRPPAGEEDRTLELRYAEYITSFKRYLYSQAWIDLLVEKLGTAEGFKEWTGREPVHAEQDSP